MLKIIHFILILMLFVSCHFFESQEGRDIVAKAHGAYLYKDQLKDFDIPLGLNEADSISILLKHIDNWAITQLLMFEARQNMTQKKEATYNKLVDNYKANLFISDYKNAYVQKKLNTVISKTEINKYYQKYKQSFLLKEDLVQVSYIHLPLNYKNTFATKKLFTRFTNEAIEELKNIELSFKKSDLNLDNSWSRYDELIDKFPTLLKYKKNEILKENSFFQFKDENGCYLIKFKEILQIGNPSPIQYVEKQIKQILLNKRKIQLKRELEQEIIKDALQTKDYKIFQ